MRCVPALDAGKITARTVINVAYVLIDRYEDEPEETVSSLIARLENRARPLRAERARNLRQPIDRLASLAAGVLLDEVVAPFAHRRILPIVEGRYGKPDFHKSSGLHFSLSHSRTAACCAVSHHPVGIDVETLVNPYEDLCVTCLTDAEVGHVKGCLNQAERIRMFTRLWTRKEALGKYLGCGIEESVLRTDMSRWPIDAATVLPSWRVDGSCETTPRVETLDLDKACLSVCGHGEAYASHHTLEEILTSTPSIYAIPDENASIGDE